MKSKKLKKKIGKVLKFKNGFTVIILDLIFVALGVYLLILGLILNKDTLASLFNAFKR